jgi:putative ABC transport system permease protein
MTMLDDVRLATRLLFKDRGFTAAAVLALSMGIAATNTMFTIVNGALLRDLPFDEPDRIVMIRTRHVASPGRPLDGLSYLDFADWRSAARTLEALGAYDDRTMNVSDEERAAERFEGAMVSDNVFSLIGQRPILGRDFRPEDNREGAAPVVILGHGVWQARYGADPGVIGRSIRVNGVPSIVVGVMGQGFAFPQLAQLWQPLTLLPPESKTERALRGLRGVGKLRDDVGIEQATTDLSGVAAALASRYPETNRDIAAHVEVFRSGIGGDTARITLTLLGMVSFVLLIACGNVANLMLARGFARTREVSVRLALGATRATIVRQLLTESVVLALVAGVVGLGLSFVGVRAFWRAAANSNPPYWLQFPIDWRVLAFLVAICLGTAVLFGLAPAVHTAKVSLVEALSAIGRGNIGSRRGRRWASALVVAQLTLALVMMTGTGLLLRYLIERVRMGAGVDTATLSQLRLDMPPPKYDTPEQRLGLYRILEERLAALSEFRVSLASAAPLDGGAERHLVIDGRPEPDARNLPSVTVVSIGDRYFDTIAARWIRGRRFERGDGEPGRGAVIINERLAQAFFPGIDPIGRRIQLRTPTRGNASAPAPEWMTIVGVAQNVRQEPPASGSFDPVAYLPWTANPVFSTNLIVRSNQPLASVASSLRRLVASVDADLPLYDIDTVDAHLASQRWAARLFGGMFTVFGVVALLLATVGLYAVTSYSVSQRARELGVRIALGARARQVLWVVTRSASAQIGIGLILGVMGAVALGNILPEEIVGSRGTDAITLSLVTTLLVAAALTASLLPARRATRLDPMATLRSE